MTLPAKTILVKMRDNVGNIAVHEVPGDVAPTEGAVLAYGKMIALKVGDLWYPGPHFGKGDLTVAQAKEYDAMPLFFSQEAAAGRVKEKRAERIAVREALAFLEKSALELSDSYDPIGYKKHVADVAEAVSRIKKAIGET